MPNIEKYINDNGKECYRNVTEDTVFSSLEFHMVMSYISSFSRPSFDNDIQFALHTNLGSLTVLNRLTGFGWRDTETGYRSKDGKFWLASGGYDVRDSEVDTIGEAIEWVKERANNCKGE